jgi:hypothetical protein
MTDPAMSPAQKILAAFNDRHELCGPFDDNWQELCLAAALCAAADEVVPADGSRKNNEIRAELLAIAAELRGQP